MKRIYSIVLLALGTSLVHAADVSALHATLPADLVRAVAAFDRAQVKGDGRALGALLADDYVLLNSQAKVENRADFIRDYTAPGWSLKPYEVEHEIVRSWNDGAVLGGVVTLQGTSNGKPFKARLRFADVWRKRKGRWQVIYTQAMRVAAP